MKRLQAGKVMRLFLAGASVVELTRVFGASVAEIEAALRRQIARVTR